MVSCMLNLLLKNETIGDDVPECESWFCLPGAA